MSITQKAAGYQLKQQRIALQTFPWISYLMGPSNSAPKAMSLVIVPFKSVTVKDSMVE
jgi:hypothetical protein